MAATPRPVALTERQSPAARLTPMIQRQLALEVPSWVSCVYMRVCLHSFNLGREQRSLRHRWTSLDIAGHRLVGVAHLSPDSMPRRPRPLSWRPPIVRNVIFHMAWIRHLFPQGFVLFSLVAGLFSNICSLVLVFCGLPYSSYSLPVARTNKQLQSSCLFMSP